MLAYIFFRLIVAIVSFIPLNILYSISNFVKWVLHRGVKYRRNIVESNLKACFPEKNKDEIEYLISQFYNNFSQVLLEGLKALSMDEAEINRRYVVKNPKVLSNYLNQQKSVILAATHFTNWEWGGVSIGVDFPNKILALYKSIRNFRIEQDVIRRRAKSSLVLLNTRETRNMIDRLPEGVGVIMAADQNPSNIKEAIWVTFFNRDTACLHGIEKYAIPYHLPVLYCDMKRVSQGHYEYSFVEIWDGRTPVQPGQITQKYMSALESTIRNKPENWLWSHKRWKHTKN